MESNNYGTFSQRRRSDSDHDIGDSMPGTIGDAQRTLHDKYGQTPAIQDDVEVPSDHEAVAEETTEDNGEDVETLVARL